MKMLKKFVTIKEAAELLGVSPLTLRRWDNAGRLTTRRHPINRYRLYDRKKLSKILTETHV
jgi:excisionase family DNA binding protein